MSAPIPARRITSWLGRNQRYVVATAIQLVLFPFGHWFDTRIFFGTGAAVAHGLSPYLHYELTDYYSSPSLVGDVSGTGYAPPWSMFLAAMYTIAYVPTGNPFVLNFAIKIPIILGNLLLARFVQSTLTAEGCDATAASRAEFLVLFNPFLLYTSTFWTMFDTLVALLMLVSFQCLSKDKPLAAGLALGLSIAMKHVALPVVPLGWLWIARRPLPSRDRLQLLSSFTSALLGVAIVCVFLPFYVFDWAVSGFVAAATHQTVATGGFTVYNIIPIDLASPSVLSILGYLPFVVAAGVYIALRRRPLENFRDLSEFALIILIAFMTSRTFLAEQNLAVIFPLILFPELLDGRGFRASNHFLSLFLVYTLLNSIPIHFAFLMFPNAFDLTVAITTAFPFGVIRQGLLFACAVVWLALGWNYIVRRV